MSQPERIPPGPEKVATADGSVAPDTRALQARLHRLRTLRGVWTELNRARLLTGAPDLEAQVASIRAQLSQLTQSPTRELREQLGFADREMDGLERAMRDITADVPISTLRATLPDAVTKNRAAVLDLLDVMLGDAAGDLSHRISAVDYLITLLCTDESPQGRSIQRDPVGLTPRLRLICEGAETGDAVRHTRAELDFYAAAQADALTSSDAAELEREKAELGSDFFAPRVLRAITTYNASQLTKDPHCAPAAPPARDPVAAEQVYEVVDVDVNLSVFETPALQPLVEALRRRKRCEPQTRSSVDRVAWALDLSIATPAEIAMLLDASGYCRAKPNGAAVLVGLLCKSADTLHRELAAIGISPEVLATRWVTELSDVIKAEVQQRLRGDSYNEACLLSDLRSKFLDHGSNKYVVDRRSTASRPNAPSPPKEDRRAMRRAATDIVGEALRDPGPSIARRGDPAGRDNVQSRLVKLGVALLAVVCLGAGVYIVSPPTHPGRATLRGSDMAQISTYLSEAQRDGDGAGPSFVGTLDASWSDVSPEKQEALAIDMIAALRVSGARNIIIYDSDHRVRIQAIGDGAIQFPTLDVSAL